VRNENSKSAWRVVFRVLEVRMSPEQI